MKKIISFALVLTFVFAMFTTSFAASEIPNVINQTGDWEVINDGKGVKDLLPDDMWEEMYEEMDVDEDEFWEDLEDQFDDMKEQLEEMDGYSIDYKITDVDDMKKSEVKDLNEELEDYLDDDIDGAAVVTVEITYSFEYDGEEYEEETEMEFTVFEYNGSWYIVPDDLGMFM